MKKNGWNLGFSFPLPDRVAVKPRTEGLTMIIDKGTGLRQTLNILEMCSEYIDYWKLSFGSSALYSPQTLRKKIELVNSFNVKAYPGGTFLEIAYAQCRLDTYLRRAFELGFPTIEVSDGTIQLSPRERSQIIRYAREVGFEVISEIGKKAGDEDFIPLFMAEQVNRDLDDGALKVIMEARESGKSVTIYNNQGNIEQEKLNDFLNDVAKQESIMWEAPLKGQQIDFITMFGPNVSLGNIQPDEVIALESLRTGMRADTFILSLSSKHQDYSSDYFPV